MPSSTSLSHQSDEFTQETNQTGYMTRIGVIQPGDDLILHFLNAIERGEKPGFPLIAKFRQGGGADMPVNSSLLLAAKLPGDPLPRPVSEKVDNIQAWVGQDINTQRNEEHIDSVKVPLLNPSDGPDADVRVNIRDVDEFLIMMDSSAQVGWGAGETEVYMDDNLYQSNRE